MLSTIENPLHMHRAILVPYLSFISVIPPCAFPLTPPTWCNLQLISLSRSSSGLLSYCLFWYILPLVSLLVPPSSCAPSLYAPPLTLLILCNLFLTFILRSPSRSPLWLFFCKFSILCLFSLRPFFLNSSAECLSPLICCFVFKPRIKGYTRSRARELGESVEGIGTM